MNIKEVEKEVGIRKANIRYYEEQGGRRVINDS